jgi:hypothetical protein
MLRFQNKNANDAPLHQAHILYVLPCSLQDALEVAKAEALASGAYGSSTARYVGGGPALPPPPLGAQWLTVFVRLPRYSPGAKLLRPKPGELWVSADCLSSCPGRAQAPSCCASNQVSWAASGSLFVVLLRQCLGVKLLLPIQGESGHCLLDER